MYYDYDPNSEIELLLNNNTWNLHYHMLFVDNPIGVGFSYLDDPAGKKRGRGGGEGGVPNNKRRKIGGQEGIIHTRNNIIIHTYIIISFLGYANTLDDVANDLYIFLSEFFVQYSQFSQNDLYIFGESYGGKYESLSSPSPSISPLFFLFILFPPISTLNFPF